MVSFVKAGYRIGCTGTPVLNLDWALRNCTLRTSTLAQSLMGKLDAQAYRATVSITIILFNMLWYIVNPYLCLHALCALVV